MDLKQAQALLLGTNAPPTSPTNAPADAGAALAAPTPSPGLTPKTDSAMLLGPSPDTAGIARSVPVSMPTLPPGVRPTLGQAMAQEAKTFKEQNQIDNVPLDIDTGASGWERFMLGFRREKSNQIKYLENKYGPGTVREASNGELIVRMPDPNNVAQTKDVLVNEDKMSAKDFIGLMGQAPEIAASMFATEGASALPYIGKLKGVVGALRDLGAMAIGGESVGAAKDVAMNVYDKGSLDLANVAKERAGMGLMDAAVGAVSLPVAKFFQFMKNPAAGYRKQVQFDALAAQKYFAEKYGVNVPLTIGESTGMPLASRSEVFIEKMPGGSEPLRAIKGQQESAFRKLQNILMGTNPPMDEEVGNAAMQQIRDKMEPVQEAVQTAKAGVKTQALSGIEGVVAGASQPEREIYKSATGEDIRKAVIAKRDAAKAETDALYEAVNNAPGGQGKVFDGSKLQTEFQKIRSSLPSPEQWVKNPTPILNAQGTPISATAVIKTPLRTLVPDNILSQLDEVIGLKGPKFSLSDFQQMRRDIYDAIGKSEGSPGLGAHYLNDMAKAVTAAIDDGISKLPTGDLKTALGAANTAYKTKVVPFNRQGLTELFKTADEPGFVSGAEITQRLLGGPKAANNWQLLKETVGDNSPEFLQMKRSVFDNILNNSRLVGENELNAKSLRENLIKFSQEQPEIAKDLFGARGGALDSLINESRYLGISQGDKVDADQLQQLLQSGNVSGQKLQALVDAQKTADEAYKNQLVKAIASGDMTESTLRPTDFVNRILDNSSTKDVKAVMDMIKDNPQLTQDLRQKTFQKVFRDAARSANADDVNRIMSGQNTSLISGVKIADRLKDAEYTAKLKTILGDEGFTDLNNYVKLQTAPEAKEASFKAAGGLAAGSQIAQLERRGVLAYLSDSARHFIYSTLLTKPPLRNWLTSIPNEPGKLSLLLSNPIFLQAVTREFGEGTAAEAFMNNLKHAIDGSLTAQPQAGLQQQPTDMERRRAIAADFLKQGGMTNAPAPAR